MSAAGQASGQHLLSGDPVLQVGQVAAERRRSIQARIRQRTGDLGEAQAQRLQVLDLQQPKEVRLVVEPVVPPAASGGGQQAEVVVVAQRSPGQAGALGNFPDSPGAAYEGSLAPRRMVAPT